MTYILEQTRKGHFFKYLAESLLVFLITAVLGLFFFIFPPVVLVLTIPLIYITVKRGFFYGFLPIIMISALLWWFFGTAGAAIFITLFVPVIFIISYVLQNNTRSFEAVVFSVGAYAIGLGLFVAFFYFIRKTDLITYIVNILEGFMTSNPGTAHEFLFLANFGDIISGVKNMNAVLAIPEAEAIKNALEEIKTFLQSTLPTFFSEYTILGGFLSYVISRALLKKHGVKVVPIPAFSSFRLPKGFFIGLVMIAVMLAAGSLLNLPNYKSVFEACYAAYTIVFTVAGLSFLDFLLVRRNMNKGGRIALLILSGLLVLFILAWVGLFDSLFKIKERIEKPDEFDE